MNVIADLLPGFAEHRVKTDGAEIKSGHFLAEENPQATLAALIPFSHNQRARNMMAVIAAEGVMPKACFRHDPRAGTQDQDGAVSIASPGSRICGGANSGMSNSSAQS